MKYHFIGIKGSGMSAMANVVLDLGHTVSGSDIDKFIFTQARLEERGVTLLPFNPQNIEGKDVVIIGNTFDESHPEVKAALLADNVTVYRYPQFLAKLLNDHIGISIVGTHGKTTTTGMISHILEPLKRGFLIGDGTGEISQDAKYFVAESCEYKDVFLNYHPQYAVILNMELDHVDYFENEQRYYQSFQKFMNQVQKGIAINGDEPELRALKPTSDVLYFGFNDDNDVRAVNIVDNETNTEFDLFFKNELLGHYRIELVGRHFLYDALGCITILLLVGIDHNLIQQRIATFMGTKRRFNVETFANNVYIDDYAHHPTEIRVTLEAMRRSYPNRKIIAVFKPDRPSRMTYFKDDFKEAFTYADVAYSMDYANHLKEDIGEISAEDFAKYCNVHFVDEDDFANAEKVAANGDAVYGFFSTKDVYKFKDKVKAVHKNEY